MGLSGGLAANGGLSGSVETAASSPFTAIEGSGHSYLYGNDATSLHGYFPKLASILGLTGTNRAIAGAIATSDQAAPAGNGASKVLRDLPGAAGSAPYLPQSSLYIVHFGINDVANLGPGINQMAAIKSALRTIISRIRAAAVFEDSHASVAYGGAWAGTYTGDLNAHSGAGFAYGATNGMTVTITVPADFPGGTIALGVGPVVANWGSTHTITVDGSGAGATVLNSLQVPVTGKNNSNQAVIRLTGLAPGAHTIVDTITAITTDAAFDYWQIEAPEPPLVLLPTQPRLVDYSAWSTWAHQPTDASVQQLNVAIRQLAAEFDSYVKVVELDALMGGNAALFDAGSAVNRAHPNDAGHSMIAAACLRTAQTGPWNPGLATAA